MDKLDQCALLLLPKFHDERGNLTVIESGRHVPFEINRIYYLYDIPGGADRGGHAHKSLRQLIVALAGSFDITLDDGFCRKTVSLNRANVGLLICPMVWRELKNFSSGAVCLVLASDFFLESDYIRNYSEFQVAAGVVK
jgi:hypothetical protein